LKDQTKGYKKNNGGEREASTGGSAVFSPPVFVIVTFVSTGLCRVNPTEINCDICHNYKLKYGAPTGGSAVFFSYFFVWVLENPR